MERVRVRSSNIASIGYNPESRVLEIEFHDGAIYQYFDVPQRLHDGLMNASSHGSYFDANIKKANFRYKKVS